MQQQYTSEALALALKVEQAIRSINCLKDEARKLEREFAEELKKVSPIYYRSACNLLHYLALRRHDIRELQYDLSKLGLSSLGRLEAHVLASLNATLLALYVFKGESTLARQLIEQQPMLDYDLGKALLREQTVAILGTSPPERSVRVMVTMPSEAAENPNITRLLLAQGMNIMRINCAHDDAEAWLRTIRHLRQAERELNQSCRISFDLAGPKLRTGEIVAGPELVKFQPKRNQLGQVVEPAKIYLTLQPPEHFADGIALPIGGTLLNLAQVGDIVQLTDTRGFQRRLRVVEVAADTCTCEAERTGYVLSGTELLLYRGEELLAQDAAGKLPPLPQALSLSPGDILTVTTAEHLGQPAIVDEAGTVLQPTRIGCTLPQVFQDAKLGDRIFFDDGKIGGIIREIGENQLNVEIIYAAGGVAKLRAEKGINLPDTQLNLPALTAKDLADLAFAAQHGDMVALSFVQRPEDVEQLIVELNRLGAEQVGIILKVESQSAFEHLPKLLLAALRHPPVAVMVARGDLGVEVGFERLAEVQEEILWLSEAAHVPVIWATQVLESLAKRGTPTRAEVTDAAMGGRAECVMLNKGPYIEKAVHFLCDVLQRMQSHQEKRTATLRQLHISELR
jgi:pyruvate kinase